MRIMPSQNDSKKIKYNIIVRCEDFPEKKKDVLFVIGFKIF